MTTKQMITIDLVINKKELQKTLNDPILEDLTLRFLSPRETFKGVAKILSDVQRPLKKLALIDLNYEPGAELGKSLLNDKNTERFWESLPDLQTLHIVGHDWLALLEHPKLKSLSLSGFAFGDGLSIAKKVNCPELESLIWEFTSDKYGVAYIPEAFMDLWAAEGLRKLHTLDLKNIELDGALLTDPTFLDGKLLSQLENFVLPTHVEAAELKKALPKMKKIKRIFTNDESLLALDPRISLWEDDQSSDDDSGDTQAQEEDSFFMLGYGDSDAAVKKEIESIQGRLKTMSAYCEVSAKMATQIGALVKLHPTLELIHIENQTTRGWTQETFEAFESELDVLPNMRVLELAHNRLKGAGAALARMIRKMPALEKIDLCHTRLSAEDLQQVLPALSECGGLKEVRLGGAAKDEAAAEAWSAFSSKTLQVLVMWGAKFSESSCTEFLTDFGHRFPALKTFEHAIGYHSSSMLAFARGCHGHQHLENIEIEIVASNAAYSAFAELLKNTKIKRLQIGEFTPRGEEVPADLSADRVSAFENAQHLEVLDLQGLIDKNQAEMVRALLTTFVKLPKLTEVLGLSFDDETLLEDYASLLKKSKVRSFTGMHPELVKLVLRDNTIEHYSVKVTHNGTKRLAQMVSFCESNTSLVSLGVVGGEMDAELVKAIKATLATIQGLERLVLDVKCSEDRLLTMLRAAKKTPTLKEVVARPFSAFTTEHLLQASAKIKGPRLTFL